MEGADNPVSGIWTRIERLLSLHAPEVLATLGPGASAIELNELESKIQLKLPPDLRASLEIHNGQDDPSQCLKFCGTMGLMTVADILRDWQMLTALGIDFDREEGAYFPEKNSLNRDWWRRSCFPFGHCEGHYACVDMDPSAGLKVGRIVEHTHDGPMEETNLLSFADWLERIAAALEAGEFDRHRHGVFSAHPQFA